jgi:hypothetical protein
VVAAAVVVTDSTADVVSVATVVVDVKTLSTVVLVAAAVEVVAGSVVVVASKVVVGAGDDVAASDVVIAMVVDVSAADVVTVVTAGTPKMGKMMRFPLKPLSLHHRMHALTQDEEDRPKHYVKFQGTLPSLSPSPSLPLSLSLGCGFAGLWTETREAREPTHVRQQLDEETFGCLEHNHCRRSPALGRVPSRLIKDCMMEK